MIDYKHTGMADGDFLKLSLVAIKLIIVAGKIQHWIIRFIGKRLMRNSVKNYILWVPRKKIPTKKGSWRVYWSQNLAAVSKEGISSKLHFREKSCTELLPALGS